MENVANAEERSKYCREKGIPHEVRWYLADPLDWQELTALLGKLDLPPSALVRKSEPLFKLQYEGREMTEQEWLAVLIEHPVLIERPIVSKGDKAIVARPSERLFELL